MYVIYISNYKKKLMVVSLAVAAWIAAYLLSSLFLRSHLACNVTINNTLSFFCPLTYEIENIYINEQIAENTVEAIGFMRQPARKYFSTHQSLAHKFNSLYPSVFTFDEQKFSGSDILYHIDFSEKLHSIYGFLQVWNMPYDLEYFLEHSKLSSGEKNKSFSSEPVLLNKTLSGFLWKYHASGENDGMYLGHEVFIKKDGKMYRVSCFSPQGSLTKQQLETFWDMVRSLKLS